MSICERHQEQPAWGYNPCLGCEIEVQREQIFNLNTENVELRNRLMIETAHKDEALKQLNDSWADERQAMKYLEQVRSALGHEGDFPSMIERVKRGES